MEYAAPLLLLGPLQQKIQILPLFCHPLSGMGSKIALEFPVAGGGAIFQDFRPGIKTSLPSRFVLHSVFYASSV